MQLKGGSIVAALAILGHASACSNDLTYSLRRNFTAPPCEQRVARPRPTFPENGGRAYCTVADTIGQICQNVPGCEPDPDHDPFKYRERLGPASPPQTLPQPLPQPLNRRNLRFGYKEDVFCPEGCKPKED